MHFSTNVRHGFGQNFKTVAQFIAFKKFGLYFNPMMANTTIVYAVLKLCFRVCMLKDYVLKLIKTNKQNKKNPDLKKSLLHGTLYRQIFCTRYLFYVQQDRDFEKSSSGLFVGNQFSLFCSIFNKLAVYIYLQLFPC